MTDPVFLRRSEAAQYLQRKFGARCSKSYLAKLATIGGGPAFRRLGRVPIYSIEDLDYWAESRMSPRVASTAEL